MTESESRIRAFSDVDGSGVAPMLLASMDATARWPATRELRDWSRDVLVDAESLLDVGCGLGDVLIDVAGAGRSGPFVGVDSSREMLTETERRAAAAGVEVELRVGDASALDFDDDSFGASRTERVLQWLDDPARAIAEMVRVTEPGGWVVLIDTDWRTAATNVSTDLGLQNMRERPGAAVGGFLWSLARGAGLVDVTHRAAVHTRTEWADDGSSGIPPLDVVAMLHNEMNPDAADAMDAELAEIRQLLDAGDFFSTTTIVAVKGRVPL